ncbi:hypothetical protein M5D96_012568, partial [Drosophila gunungcola]
SWIWTGSTRRVCGKYVKILIFLFVHILVYCDFFYYVSQFRPSPQSSRRESDRSKTLFWQSFRPSPQLN